MMMDEVEKITLMLDSLAAYQQRRTLVMLDKQAATDKVMEPIRNELMAVEAEFVDALDICDTNIGDLQEAITDAVFALGESVKGSGATAVYTHPRITWDTKALDRYAKKHPEINKFRKEGKPSVSFRRNG